MRTRTHVGWMALSLVLGCRARLQVDDQPPSAGAAGTLAGGAGGESGGGGSAGSLAGGGSAGSFAGGGSAGSFAGSSAAGGDGPARGALGQPCVPGGLNVEAAGTPAETEVRTLDHCDEGLYCNSEQRCAPTPACASAASGDCVVYAAAGAGGTSGGGAGNGGTAGSAGSPAGGDGSQAVVLERPRITGLAADDSHVYWLDYGARDALGNHQHDGALMAATLGDFSDSVIASGLDGPISLGLSTTDAYVVVDGAGLIGSPTHSQLLRIPLSGGAAELLQEQPELGPYGLCNICFASSGDRVFWTGSASAVYSYTPSDGLSLVLTAETYLLAADTTYLYYAEGNSLLRLPLAGGTAQHVASPIFAYALSGDYLYGMEDVNNGTGLMLDRVPKAGNTWLRVRALGAGGSGRRLQNIGAQLFMDEYPPAAGPYVQPDFGRIELVSVRLDSSSAPPVRVLERRATNTPLDALWTGAPDAVVWSDGNAVYVRPFDSVP